jgi:hypothetical protein
MAGPEVAADSEVVANPEVAAKPSPVSKPPPQPCSTVDPEAELRVRVSAQVKRLNETIVWNDSLADEFREAERDAKYVQDALSDEAGPDPELLRPMVDRLTEQVPNIVERNEQLPRKVCELKPGFASFEGLATGKWEGGFHLLEEVSMSLGEHIDWVQQELADLFVEFKTKMISTHVPVESPVPINSPVVDPDILQPASPAASDSPVEGSPVSLPLRLRQQLPAP